MIPEAANSAKLLSMSKIKVVIGSEIPDRSYHDSQKFGKIKFEFPLKQIEKQVINEKTDQ